MVELDLNASDTEGARREDEATPRWSCRREARELVRTKAANPTDSSSTSTNYHHYCTLPGRSLSSCVRLLALIRAGRTAAPQATQESVCV